MAHRLAPEAEADLHDIWYYVAQEGGSIEIADRLIDLITARFLVLTRRTPKRRIYAFQSTLSFRIRFSGANMRALHIVIPNPLQRCQYTRLCTLSFRIRFSGEESAFHFRLIVSGSVSRHSCDVRFP